MVRRAHTEAVHRTEKAQRKNSWSLRWHSHFLAKPPHTFALFILVAGLLAGIAFSQLGEAGGVVSAVLASVLLALELGLCLLSGEVLRTKTRWQTRLAGEATRLAKEMARLLAMPTVVGDGSAARYGPYR
jgi:hypothetical protein